MTLSDTPPLIIPANLAVLLLFMPPDRQQRATLTSLADSLQRHLNGSLRILKIDEATHPEVTRSFDIIHTPAFVLVRRGVELWRQEGIPDEATLTALSQRLLGG
ncbi:thioredoxin family protein [Fibrella sp. HMF5335]|uniref:Thioredoxin family protein n=2 Tax=Fibrella rubiginis TaxID=2817060 RepID=A0A939GAF4_9BACT|nr:thioredoxin family protein [Fibrella rubiginis]